MNWLNKHPSVCMKISYRKQVWHDVQCETEPPSNRNILIPAQVLMLLDFDTIVYEDIVSTSITKLLEHLPHEENVVEEEKRHGIHLLVHSASDNNMREFDIHHDSIVHHYVMEPFFQLVTLQSVEGLVFVARDPEEAHNDQMTYKISKMLRPDLWGVLFFPRFAKNYVSPSPNDVDIEDEFDEITNPW
jgi:hypothetical protein